MGPVGLQARVRKLEDAAAAGAPVVDVFANGFGDPAEYQHQLKRAEEARRAGTLRAFFDVRPPGPPRSEWQRRDSRAAEET